MSGSFFGNTVNKNKKTNEAGDVCMAQFCIHKIWLFIILTLCIGISCIMICKKKIELFPENISAIEDLMREHGLLNRILLIYEEVIHRIDNNDVLLAIQLADALSIMKQFIEEYHEKIEEDYIFPLFEKHNQEVSLIKTLREQHIKGRTITHKLQTLVAQSIHDKQTINTIKELLHMFIDMYRPHESREDTEVFPLVRSLMTEEEYAALAEICEETEEKIFGENGFELMLKQVESIEKDLGIYVLEHYTPKI